MTFRERGAAAESAEVDQNASGGEVAALYEAALSQMRAARYLDAQLCCQQALALDADHADTLHLMGLLSLQAEQYDHAVEWLARAIRQNPKVQYLRALGTTLQRQGRLEEALRTFDKAVQLKPDDAELWRSLGNVLIQLERRADAVLSFQQALKHNPRYWDAACKSGILLYELGRLDQALVHLDLCEELQPGHAAVLRTRAGCLRDLERFEDALADYTRWHELDPANADICNSIGATLERLGRHEQALQWFDRALELSPKFVGALINKAIALTHLHRFDEAIATYGSIKTLDPTNAEAEFRMGNLHLRTGNFEAGWAAREARWRDPAAPLDYPKLSQPMWLGDGSVDGKTILVYSDEGLGDAIQFARYVPTLAARGANVILVVDDAVHPLLSALSGVSQCVPKSAGFVPPFDLHCAITSLPLAFGTRLDTIPAETSYLPPPPADRVQAWQERLGPHAKLRVGLVWSGNPRHTNDHNRSIPLRMLSRILDVDATFVSLQKDVRPADKEALQDLNGIIDLTSHLTDFAETAALISCLDLVITVDTSVAHLSGALGHPTWILLPYTSDFRWLLDRDDSPWYPMVRLFRQTESREYGSVLDRVRAELSVLCEPLYGIP